MLYHGENYREEYDNCLQYKIVIDGYRKHFDLVSFHVLVHVLYHLLYLLVIEVKLALELLADGLEQLKALKHKSISLRLIPHKVGVISAPELIEHINFQLRALMSLILINLAVLSINLHSAAVFFDPNECFLKSHIESVDFGNLS